MIRQMDVKGAYLNGTLKDNVYICSNQKDILIRPLKFAD